MNGVMSKVARRFSRLQLDGRPVLVIPKVKDSKVDRLHAHLKRIDDNYTTKITTAKDIGKVPNLMAYIESHAKITPYSFSIQKCGKAGCVICSEIRTPINGGLRALVMQRQPTPRWDPTKPGHFMTRNDALAKYAGDDKALTSTEDLPSTKKDFEVSASKEANIRDKRISAKFKLKSFEPKKVRSVVECYSCGKGRCIYSTLDDITDEMTTELELNIENVTYQCGDIFFPDENQGLGSIFIQRQNLTCSMPMEKSYFDIYGRAYKCPDRCYWCGSGVDLLRQKELVEMKITEGEEKIPICTICLQEGKTVTKRTGTRKNVTKDKKETQAKKKQRLEAKEAVRTESDGED
jgi:hypothetical protein